MQYGEHMVEQVFDAQAKVFQVSPGGGRQVGTALRAAVVTADTARDVIGRPRSGVSRVVVSNIVVVKPCGKKTGAAFDQ